MTESIMLDYLLTDAQIATMAQGGAQADGYGLIAGGAIGIKGDKIAWVGAAENAPKAKHTQPCNGKLITPALIDCHTHLVYGGNRAKEWEMRLNGASYEEIARAGGGIISTVNDTRAASEKALMASALVRLDQLMAQGVGTVEIKSGYGLNLETELKMLRVARALASLRGIRIKTTFLGAHALPPEYANRADEYITLLCDEILPAAHAQGLVDAVDGFCESIGFSPEQIARVFAKAKALNLPIKLHAEQLSNLQGAVMAAESGALSVDHLEYLDPQDIAVLKAHDTVAVLLPGAFYALGETQLPPVKALGEAGVPIAIATDHNPGSSPLCSLLLAMNMACTLFRLTPAQALAGCTRHAAKALGLQDSLGSIETGKTADLAIWNVSAPAELAYHIGHNPLAARVIGGKI
jgi:imidazolonepropionase